MLMEAARIVSKYSFSSCSPLVKFDIDRQMSFYATSRQCFSIEQPPSVASGARPRTDTSAFAENPTQQLARNDGISMPYQGQDRASTTPVKRESSDSPEPSTTAATKGKNPILTSTDLVLMCSVTDKELINSPFIENKELRLLQRRLFGV